MNNLYSKLQSNFPNLEFKQEIKLSKYTAVKIGGPAEVFCETKTSEDFLKLVSYAIKNKLPLTILGWGANTLISDNGIKGLVIKNTAHNIKILNNTGDANSTYKNIIKARWQSDKNKGTFKYNFLDLDYDESSYPTAVVEVDSGTSLPFLINYLINEGLTGLQWYSRIPATLGGAIYNNIHGGTHFISELIESVKVIDEQGNIQTIVKQNLEAGYDNSRFHHTKEIIISAKLKLFYGNKEKAKEVVKQWATRKAIQPQKSLGCVFQNITDKQKNKLNYPTTSVGYIIEHILHKKNYRVGDAKISNSHAAFIENVNQATAKDYLEIIKTIIAETKEKTGIILKPEIFFLGFKQEELSGIIY